MDFSMRTAETTMKSFPDDFTLMHHDRADQRIRFYGRPTQHGQVKASFQEWLMVWLHVTIWTAFAFSLILRFISMPWLVSHYIFSRLKIKGKKMRSQCRTRQPSMAAPFRA